MTGMDALPWARHRGNDQGFAFSYEAEFGTPYDLNVDGPLTVWSDAVFRDIEVRPGDVVVRHPVKGFFVLPWDTFYYMAYVDRYAMDVQ